MKYKTAADLRQAITARMRSLAKEKSMPIERLHRHIAFERLLARLLKEPVWTLKGGYAMELRMPNSARSTKDIDLAVTDAQVVRLKQKEMIDHLHNYLVKVASEDLGDFFFFEIKKELIELSAPPYGGIRFRVHAMLGNKRFSVFNIDMVEDNLKLWPFDQLASTNMLAFAGLDCPEFPAIKAEQHFAEKVHAYTSSYGDRINTRVKDLVDLVLLVRDGNMDKKEVIDALSKIFNKRNTHPLPQKFPRPPEQWQDNFERMMRDECKLEMQLEDAYQLVNNYCDELGVNT